MNILNLRSIRYATVVLGIVAATLSTTANAVVVDGIFSANEGYNNIQPLSFQLDNGTMVADPGQLAWTQDAQGNVFVSFIQPLSINDNTYGTNAVGWGTRHHNFGDLVGSDKGHFDFTNAAGQAVLSFDLDYISRGQTNGTYMSLGVTGGDGHVQRGSSSSVLAYGTSLGYNLNTLGHNSFTTNSPATTPHTDSQGHIDYSQPYADPADAAGWVYYIEYEVEVSASAFGSGGFGGVTVPYAHDSPSKVGQNTVPVCTTCVPEAGTYIGGLFAIGVAMTQIKRLRRQAIA